MVIYCFYEVVSLTVNRLSGDRVLITLCNKDMSDFSLDFGKMSMSDSHSRRVILRIMQVACRRSGISVSGKRLNVEAMLLGEDCYLLVTVAKKPGRTYRLKNCGSVCYRLGSAGNLLNAIEKLYRTSVVSSKNAVFELDGNYYLIFEHYLPSQLRAVLNEFAQKKGGNISAAKVREYGSPVCEHNAVRRIGSYL